MVVVSCVFLLKLQPCGKQQFAQHLLCSRLARSRDYSFELHLPRYLHSKISAISLYTAASMSATALRLVAGGLSEKFYSHSKRTEEELRRDTHLNIDRRCFSNLWQEDMQVPCIPLLQHDFLQKSSGVCVEAWFQAAKCKDENAAKFCFELPSSKHQAQFGRGHLPLRYDQVEYFTSRQMPLEKVNVMQEYAGEDDSWPARSHRALMKNKKQMFDDIGATDLAYAGKTHISIYVPKLRGDWEEIKDRLMLELQKAKFGTDGQATAIRSAEGLLAAGILHVTEHAEDPVWGDKITGQGNNRQGKIIAAVLSQKSQRALSGPTSPDLEWSAELQILLEQPAVLSVHYD